MRLRSRVILATVLTVAACAVAWLACLRVGPDGDSTGTVVGLVAFAVGAPLTVWAGPEDEAFLVKTFKGWTEPPTTMRLLPLVSR
ncbi:hypothetical protein [Streptosporangium sp. LJ11]|uniref:hypothetical protein n=1 Tax=Streptosporangium sp. LJ11 TaxID=3436927 RepID=UPI003F7922CF